MHCGAFVVLDLRVPEGKDKGRVADIFYLTSELVELPTGPLLDPLENHWARLIVDGTTRAAINPASYRLYAVAAYVKPSGDSEQTET